MPLAVRRARPCFGIRPSTPAPHANPIIARTLQLHKEMAYWSSPTGIDTRVWQNLLANLGFNFMAQRVSNALRRTQTRIGQPPLTLLRVPTMAVTRTWKRKRRRVQSISLIKHQVNYLYMATCIVIEEIGFLPRLLAGSSKHIVESI